MEPGGTWQIPILIALLGCSAFFSASETALMSLSKIRIRHMVDSEVKNAPKIQRLVDQPSRMLGAILVGNNVVNIGASSLATSLFMSYFGASGVGIATAVMTVLVLIFGEITPKSLAAERSENVALRVASPISIITRLLSPLITVLLWITNGIVRLTGGKADTAQPFITEEELKTMVSVSSEEGVLEDDEKKMIYNVFDFGDAQVKDVMTPRPDMVAVSIDASYEDVMNLFKSERFSRLPVYDGTTDNIKGVLHLKDLFFYDGDFTNFHASEHIRDPYFTYEFKKIAELFNDLRNERLPLAIVLDEYGGTAGVVTIEDLVEEIVGDIEDEYDDQIDEIEVIQEDEYIVNGSMRIVFINEMLGINIESEDFDSIGGYVVGEFGRLPDVGETITVDEIEFHILEIEKNRIEKLKILT